MRALNRPTWVTKAHWSDDNYFLSVSLFNVSEKSSTDLFNYFYLAGYKEVEPHLDPLYDEMHFYKTQPEADCTPDEALYLLKTAVKTDDYGYRILHIFRIQAYCDVRGALFS